MRLEVKIPVSLSPDPLSPEALAAAEGAISEKASAWTAPVYERTEDGFYLYVTDAVPRGITTTANVAPALLRPRIL